VTIDADLKQGVLKKWRILCLLKNSNKWKDRLAENFCQK